VCCEEVGFWPKRRGQSVDGKKWRSFCGHHLPLFLVTPRFHYLHLVWH
jgi:hypothetical protein